MVLLVKVSENADTFCKIIGIKYRVLGQQLLVSVNYYFTITLHGIEFRAKCNGTVIICRTQADDAPIPLSRCFEEPVCSNTFTKSVGVKISQCKSAQL